MGGDRLGHKGVCHALEGMTLQSVAHEQMMSPDLYTKTMFRRSGNRVHAASFGLSALQWARLHYCMSTAAHQRPLTRLTSTIRCANVLPSSVRLKVCPLPCLFLFTRSFFSRVAMPAQAPYRSL